MKEDDSIEIEELKGWLLSIGAGWLNREAMVSDTKSD